MDILRVLAQITGAAVMLLGGGLILYSVVLLVRNERVYRYRTYLINEIYNRRIDGGWEALHKASYHQMVNQFWRPLPSFYRGTILDAEGLLDKGRDG